MSSLPATGNVSPIELTHEGVILRLHKWTDAMRAQYVNWMKASAIRDTVALKGVLPDADYRIMLHDLNTDIVVRKLYDFGGERYNEFVKTPEGSAQLLRVMFQNNTLSDNFLASFMVAQGDELTAHIEVLEGVEHVPDTTDAPPPKA